MRSLSKLIKEAIRNIIKEYSSISQSRWGINAGIDSMMESRQKLKQQQDAQRLKRQQLGIKE